MTYYLLFLPNSSSFPLPFLYAYLTMEQKQWLFFSFVTVDLDCSQSSTPRGSHPPLIRRNGPLLILSRLPHCTVNRGEISFWRRAFSVNSIKPQRSQPFVGSHFQDIITNFFLGAIGGPHRHPLLPCSSAIISAWQRPRGSWRRFLHILMSLSSSLNFPPSVFISF